jgi:hypothetical protein
MFRGQRSDQAVQMIVNYNTDGLAVLGEWSGTGLRPIDDHE